MEARHFPRGEIGLQCLDDPLSQFGLDGKKIRQFAIESFGPNVGVGASVDELCIDPHPIAGTAHCAFQHMGYAERFADLAQVADTGSILLYRGPADDLQVRDLRQAGENVVVHSVREEGVLPVVAQVFEGQHGDAFLRRPSSRGDSRRGRILGPFDPGGSDIIGPGQDDCDRKSEDERRDDQPHSPIRDFEKRKNLGSNLNQDPCDHDVGDRDAIHFAPF